MPHDCPVCQQRTALRDAAHEKFVDEQITWPRPYRTAVNFVFNYQGNEGKGARANGRVDYELFSEQEYGRRSGIARVLRLLADRGVTGTFLVCGALAEHYPDTVRAIVAGGHEIAGHGYHHEVTTDLPVETEREIAQESLAILRTVTGATITGWRTCFQSPHTPAVVAQLGLRYNSHSFLSDLPYLHTFEGRTIVEVVRQPFGDMRTFGKEGFGGDPQVAFEIWRTAFDTLYAESDRGPTYCPYSMHPFLIGRPGRIDALARLIDHVQARDGVWVSTMDQVATAVLDSVGVTAPVPA